LAQRLIGDLQASKRSFALSLFASGAFPVNTELAVIVLPLLAGRESFRRCTVLCDCSVLYTEQIIDRRLLPAERALADHKYEIRSPSAICALSYFIVIPWAAIASSAEPRPERLSAIANCAECIYRG
jgi:hypothetical protein